MVTENNRLGLTLRGPRVAAWVIRPASDDWIDAFIDEEGSEVGQLVDPREKKPSSTFAK